MKKNMVYLSCGLILVIIFSLIVMGLPKEGKGSEPKEAVVLTMMLPQTHYKDFFIQLIKKFEEDHPDIQIDPQVIPDNTWTEVVKTKVQVRETPDIIRIEKSVIKEVGVEHLVEMTEEASWFDRVILEQRESKMLDGKLYGLPVESGPAMGVVYNREIFEANHLEIPKNMEEFREVCRKLKARGIIPLFASDKDSWTVQVPFNITAPQLVSEKVWEELRTGKLKWSEVGEFEQILQDMRDLREDGYTNVDYMDATYTSATNAMAHGEAAMYIMGGFFIQEVQTLNPEIDLMVFPVPYGKDVLTIIEGGGQFSVFKDSRHSAEAAVFLEWLSQPENMDVFTEGWSYMPVFVDQNQKLTKYHQFLQNEYIVPKRTVPSLQNTIPDIDWSDYWDYQQEVYAGVITPMEALEKWDISFKWQIK